jgi:alkylation response protein AidB-like acyl-CoA dehydrogenase
MTRCDTIVSIPGPTNSPPVATLGISEDHQALHDTARRWVEHRCPPAVARAALDSPHERPPFWTELAELGWLGLHVGEEHGGSGGGLGDLAVVLEELGRACAPGPFLPTVLAGAVVDRAGSAAQRDELLPALVDGSATAAVAWSGAVDVERRGTAVTLRGVLGPVLGGAAASLLVVPADGRWVVLDRSAVDVVPLTAVDGTRDVAEVRLDGCEAPPERWLEPCAVDELAAVLLAAECVGGAAWCVETAAAHAKVREQFGRPIGQFQAVKHRCADMLLALEQARAAAWDGARGGEGGGLAASVAAALGPAAFLRCAMDCIQVLGAIGFAWEHDAHLYLKRAMAAQALAGDADRWRQRVAACARAGPRRRLAVDLPAEAEVHRDAVRAFLDDNADVLADHARRREALVASGYLVPHWPRPWGRDAGPVEQLVIDEELRAARIRRPHLQVAAWALPALIAHGSPEQHERWVPRSLRGELTWCQLFSEPGAGSDLAALSTKAVRVDGGWLLSGQKTWTTMAATADLGLALARTDPSVPKHDGISCFVVDMRSPGVEVRPLRELTGHELFNEVFLSDVFVPDDHVVGSAGDGWRVARTTLENERVSMGSGSSFGPGVEAVLRLLPDDDPALSSRVGALVAEAHSLAVLGLRLTARAVAGVAPGPEASVRKLLGVEHEQRVQEVGLGLFGAAGAASEGEAAGWVAGFLGNRALTIAGGTSEVQRNVIAERLLGLPRDAGA